MKILLTIVLSVLSLSVFAHSGHGDSSVLSHDIEHGIWYLSGFVLLAGIVWGYLSKR